jgi:predicted small secreted protein
MNKRTFCFGIGGDVMKSIVNLIFLLLLSVVIFTTCDTPMGMGKPIDWDPPILTIDPVPNPLYVRYGTTLTGTATDNVGVDRIVFINTATGKEIFPVAINGNNWSIELLFTAEQNGEKITGEIRAYDKMGNSGEMSVAIITMIIDIRPPVVESMTIKRTDTRIARLESFRALKALEETEDRQGERKDALYRYQNGWFYIDGVVDDEETKIEIISLDFYDVREIDTLLISLRIDEGYTNYFPRWTIKEENIINAGVVKWGGSYKTDYYDAKERYYYRVVIKAIDKSENQNVTVEEDEGYICMWAKSDEPKGILDPAIGTVVARGTPLPVDFFDDDSLLWAYTGLLTLEQWNGYKLDDDGVTKLPVYVAPGAQIPVDASDEQKLEWLKIRLRKGGDDGKVYNWKYDKHKKPGNLPDDSEPIYEQIDGKSLDEKLVYVSTGNGEFDYGDYVLFTLAADKKLSPHSGTGPEWTNTNIEAGKFWKISVIDENAPLIVFNTAEGSPEENTFPPLDNGEFFTIKGYTLRENATGMNKVTKFRMAWIPFGMPGSDGKPNADGYIKTVQTALSKDNFDGMPDDVQYWEFKEGGAPGYGKLDVGINEEIDGNNYLRQSFSKKFSVLGGPDDVNPSTKNFIYGKDDKGNDKLENETKLFIFYAVDNMGHEVFRQLRLLSNKTPPDLVIYDISNKFDNASFSGMPDPNEGKYADTLTGGLNNDYYTALNTYNTGKYATLKTVSASLTDDDKTIPFQIYPRGTILKYWVRAANSEDIAVQSITMTDITYSGTAHVVGSGYVADDMTLSFCEYYPDVTQRTFLFVATDKLGNEARIQRTIAVTNAARLENITTTSQSGTNGIGKVITLKANFSSQIYLTGGLPRLNIRYTENGTLSYGSLPCKNPPTYSSPSLALEYDFTVREGMSGVLETTFENMIPAVPTGVENDFHRPIWLSDSTVKIMDYMRGDAAFIPGYRNESVTMPNWENNANTLQKNKTITLDGRRPRITTVSVGGKTAHSPSGDYYFKTGETINFTITADKPIRASDTPIPTLSYQIRQSNNTLNTYNSAAYQEFKYQRPDGQNALVFSLPVNATTCPVDGELLNVFLYTVTGAGEIRDNVDNLLDLSGITSFAPTDGKRIFIKKTVPVAPTSPASPDNANGTAKLNNAGFGANPNTLMFFNTNPTLVIYDSSNTFTTGSIPWEDTREYSLNGGVSWAVYSGGSSGISIPAGTHTLQVRYKDRAGNEGVVRSQLIHVIATFPKLVAASAVQPSGWYTGGQNLVFNLDFEDAVRVSNRASVIITLTNAKNPNSNNGQGVEPTYEIILQADTGQDNINRTGSSTVRFSWNSITGKEMQEGLYISGINLSGLNDQYGNPGGTGNVTVGLNANITVNDSNCKNLPAGGIKVDAIAPRFTPNPASEGVSADTDNRTITLAFNEPVMIGSGAITVKPHGNYRIPAVIEDKGYYLGTDKKRYTTAQSAPSGIATTWVAGFYDIYNNSALSAGDRNTLSMGDPATNPSMSKLALDARTGQSAGPYVKMTHGLKDGAGYTGSYPVGTNYANGAEQPSPTGTDYLIPDTATKWVLDYRYSIVSNNYNTQYATTANTLESASTTVVPNIRDVLTKAKWRWQEMDIVSSVSFSPDKKTVTITLNEPLLSGLQWDMTFPEGAFTDMAGNKAPGTPSGYWFWSNGVQTPVIRVNRKSFDARTANWAVTTPAGTAVANMRVYSVPGNLGGPGGWGINDFNTVYYRIETETPDATIYYRTEEGTEANGGSVTAGWDNTTKIGSTNYTWQTPYTADQNPSQISPGEWVLKNLIRRGGGNQQTYTVMENGILSERTITANYKGYRSFNRDIKRTELVNPAVTLNGNISFQGSFVYSALQASKNYVVAEARITHSGTNYTSDKGYEGVFRSVIALNQTSFGGGLGGNNFWNNPIMVQGSNIKNGMPSIAGFPVLDGGEMGDNRFIKLFYYVGRTSFSDTDTNIGSGQLYWVSTEIVSQWYELNSGKIRTTNASGQGGSSQNRGDVNNYLFSGYGDLSYAVAQQ